jgi:biotin transport system permease protein
MAELTVFQYKPGKTLLHRLDIRCKITCLMLLNLTIFQVSPESLLSLTLLVAFLFSHLKISVKKTLLNLRLFFLILVFILLTRAIYTPGDALLDLKVIIITRQGVYSGVIYCWRLILIFISGLVFVCSSSVSTIKSGIQWFLRPLPLVPEKRVAVMISLMIRFLPLILHQAREISEAQKARGIEKVKNPIKRLTLYSIPLLRRVFETADSLVLAMEARCFTENRTDPQLEFKPVDLAVLVLLFVLGGIIIML